MPARLPGIEYSETVTRGDIPAARAPMRVQTGAEYIARGAESLGKAFETIQDRWDNAELSTMKRNLDEMTFAAFNTYSETGDENQRKGIVNKWSADIDKLRSKSGQVNQEFALHKNSVLPHWADAFNKTEIKIRGKQTDDADAVNMQSALERNDLGGYNETVDTRQRTNRITPAEAEYLKKNAPNEAILAQAGKMIYSGDPVQGLDKLLTLDKDTLPEERAKYAKQLESAGKQARSDKLSAIENDITMEIHNNHSKSPGERLNKGEELLTKLNTIKDILPAPRYSAMMNEIEGLQAGRHKEFNPIAYVDLLRQVEQLHNGIGNPKTIRDNITQAYPQLDDAHFDSISLRAEEKIASYYADTISKLHKEATPLLAPHMMMTERLMEAEAEAKTPEQKKALHDELDKIMTGDQMKADAMRISLYMDQVNQYLKDNPNEPDLHLAAQKILGKFERYTDPQIRQMQAKAEQGIQQAGVSGQPTAEQLRRQNTKDSYEQGIRLGYWK